MNDRGRFVGSGPAFTINIIRGGARFVPILHHMTRIFFIFRTLSCAHKIEVPQQIQITTTTTTKTTTLKKHNAILK